MSKVRLFKEAVLGSLPQTWGLARIGEGPGRGEATGLASVAEAEEFARRHGHEIVERENGMENSSLNGVRRGSARYGSASLYNASPVQAMKMVIRGDLGDVSMPVADVRDASRKYREYVEREGLGSSEVGFGKVWIGGELVATIKYNGTVQLENAIKERCFACGRPLGANPRLADTRDGQTAYVGSECWGRIVAAGEVGWQPPRGGPRLYATGDIL